MARLPLEEDLEENKTVYSCLAMLYTHSPGLVRTPCPTCAPAYFQLSQPRLAFRMSEPAPCSVSVQIVSQMKTIVAAATHVLGSKDVDTGEGGCV